ncbi:ankyrin repeat and SOCS box protein 2-like [Conger conger]|uniref:ankyrin repeat and SOCS box protein 2-like n=1 Tax=Conger conger TaxID=82655 RepID=UPI002A5A9182|nr:ankyrin repeat and SOCS box protein 2-like [Conger conger]
MAAASLSMPGSRSPMLGSDDYSLYSGLSEDELIELAVEHSLADAYTSVTRTVSAKTSAFQNGPAWNPPKSNPTFTGSSLPGPHNASMPTTFPVLQQNQHCKETTVPEQSALSDDATWSHSYITDNGQRCVAWRRYNGSMYITPSELLDPVVEAIKQGAAETLIQMSWKGKSLAKPDKQGWTPLHEAAYYGQEKCLKVILKAHPELIDSRTLRQQTPLLLAAAADQVRCAQSLLQRGADPNIPNKNGETPLYKACEQENVETVALLLDHGAQVNRTCVQGWTALHEAVCRNNVEICRMLVNAGAKLNARNMYGITPLFIAAQSGRVETLLFLIKKGVDIDNQANDGATALYEASKNGHEEIVELLLSQNADANRASKCGFLPLHIAAQRGHEEVVSLLIPVTSKSDIRGSGISPLHLAAEHNEDDVLEVLIEAGYDVNFMLSPDRSKMYEDRRSTALYFAVFNSNIEATTMLLEAGANPNRDTFSPLLVALRQGCIQTVTLLVEHGANVNACVPTHPTSFPGTVMFCMKFLSLLKYLMDNGCDALSCFQCPYGSKPHPPIKTTCDRNSLDDRTEEETPNMPLQFCEIISAPEISRWAGPVIDVLLDYVGNVQLCARLTEHLDSYEDWAGIKEKCALPCSLMHMCRLMIRKQVGTVRLNQLNTLPLPERLIKYISMDRFQAC